MSTTFTIEALPTGTFRAECEDTGEVFTGADYDAVVVQAQAHKALCDECAHYGIYVQADMDIDQDGDLSLNVSGTNAHVLLHRLGIDIADGDVTGHLDGPVFLGHVLTAIAMLTDVDDEAVADVDIPRGVIGPRMILGGTRAGYLSDRLGALRAIAEEAARLGRAVTWA